MRHRLATVLLVCAVAGTTPAHAVTAPRQARWAATWLAGKVGPDDYVPGPGGAPDLGTTASVGLALAAAGVARQTTESVATYLSTHVDEFARVNGKDRPGALGRLAMLAAATGRDPNAFGGTEPANRLVDRILATRTLVGPSAGLLADPLYNGTFNHALGLLGVATARSLTAEQQAGLGQALDWLVAQQCDDGGWQNNARSALLGLTLSACNKGTTGPDTNASAVAVQALAAHRRATRVDALAWFDAAQNPAGGFGYSPDGATDADSTALVVQALLAAGVSPTSSRFTAGRTSAYAALLALQLGCRAAVADRGAFAYMRGGDGALRPNTYATAEAVPAVARVPFPIRRVPAAVAPAPVPCGSR